MKNVIKQLPNGLTIILRESHAAPVVAFQVWIGVGQADERPAESGLAHVLEHMLFKGTERRPVGEIARDVERAGGYINAWTSHDETVYHVTMASRFAAGGIDVLADAVQHAALDGEELSSELQVILEEIRMGEDSPSRVTTEMLFSRVFRKHPYRWPVIGSARTVRSFDRKVVQRFYRRWYVPGNTVVVVVGDFEESAMLDLTKKAFSKWPARSIPRRTTRKPEPVQRKIRRAHRVLPVSEANLAIGFPIPGFEHDDVPALDLLAAVLGQGASSRLETIVRRKMGLASDVRAFSFTLKDVGVFGIFAVAPPGALTELTEAISSQVFELTAKAISPREVEKARALLMSESTYVEETVDGVARKLGYYGLHSGDVEFERRYVAGLATAQPSQLLEVARRYLTPSVASIAVTVPDPAHRKFDEKVGWVRTKRGTSEIAGAKLNDALTDALKQGAKSVGNMVKTSSGPETIIHKLSGGDTLIIKADATSRIVAARAAFMGGLRHERASQSGLATLLSNSLTRGTTTKDARQIAMEMDSLACSVAGFAGRNTFGVYGEFLSRNFSEGFALMSACLRRPALQEDEIDREKQLLLDDIRASRDNLDYQAFKLFQETLFRRHPYGRSMLGTEKTVRDLTPGSLRGYLEKATGAGRMVLAVVGGVDPREVIDLAERHLVTESNDKRAHRDPADWKPRKGPLYLAKAMPKEQSHLVVGFPGTTLNSSDSFAMDVLVEILGGHGGRLFSRVREEMGLAYSVTAVSMEGIERGYLALYASTGPGQERQVVDAMLDEVERIRERRPSASEMSRVKRHLIGTRAIGSQKAGARAGSASLGYLYGLGAEMDEEYTGKIRRTSADDVVEAARRYLVRDRMIVSCVGPQANKLVLI